MAFLDARLGFARLALATLASIFSKLLKLAERLIRTDKPALGAPVGAFPFDMEVFGGGARLLSGLLPRFRPGVRQMMELVIHRDALQGGKMARHDACFIYLADQIGCGIIRALGTVALQRMKAVRARGNH